MMVKVQKAVDKVNDIIAESIIGMNVFEQAEIDHTMIDLDGTEKKGKLEQMLCSLFFSCCSSSCR